MGLGLLHDHSPRRQKKEEYFRRGLRCGSVEICRKVPEFHVRG